MNKGRVGTTVRRLIGRLRDPQRDKVTICVPAYMAAGLIAETLQAVSVQTYRNFLVLISLDPSNDGTDRACERFLADPRFTLTRQSTRLGWPGNVNYLLDQVQTEYFCVIFHDDLIEPDYLARLMRQLRRSPEAICAYPVLRRFGTNAGESSVQSVQGDRFSRAMQFFARPLHAVPLRGLTRSDVLRKGLRLRELGTGGFLAEMLYVFELALLGDCKRVGGAVYHRRCRPESVSRGWRTWSDERKRAAWRHLLRECCSVIRHQDFTPAQQLALLEAALPWAFQLGGWLPAQTSERSAISDPGARSALARRWAEDLDGNPPFL